MVHQYKLNGYNIVLDTCSGSIHSVDDLAYDVIGMIREYTQGDICLLYTSCLDLHDVKLMQEGINHAACVVLVHLKIRIVHSRVAVIPVSYTHLEVEEVIAAKNSRK